jgi:hypothetical protein
MFGKILDQIDPILYQHFDEVRDEMGEKGVAARRLVSVAALCLPAPNLQLGEEQVTVPNYSSRT